MDVDSSNSIIGGDFLDLHSDCWFLKNHFPLLSSVPFYFVVPRFLSLLLSFRNNYFQFILGTYKILGCCETSF
jgi:hypothetical protein